MAKIYDPRMHTAEHILNQTMERFFACGRCFSAHINPRKAKCDYHFTRDLTANEVRAVEAQVNAIIQADMPVWTEVLDHQKAAREFSLARLPETATDEVRIVHVWHYDACPCIGEHVERTRALGTFRLMSHHFDNGVLRLRFRLFETL